MLLHRLDTLLFCAGTDTDEVLYTTHNAAVRGALASFAKKVTHTTHEFKKSKASHMDLAGYALDPTLDL